MRYLRTKFLPFLVATVMLGGLVYLQFISQLGRKITVSLGVVAILFLLVVFFLWFKDIKIKELYSVWKSREDNEYYFDRFIYVFWVIFLFLLLSVVLSISILCWNKVHGNAYLLLQVFANLGLLGVYIYVVFVKNL